MQHFVNVDSVGFVLITKKRNSRQMRLSVHPEKGVRVSIPFGITYADAERFVFENAEWIKTKLSEPKMVNSIFNPQSHFKCRSTNLLFIPKDQSKLSIKIENYVVSIFYNPALDINFSSVKVQNFIKKGILNSMKKEAEQIVIPRIYKIAEKFSLNFSQVAIGVAKTRWGCCDSRNKITLSCMLLLLPDYLIDFVIIHELCHTIHKNHGKNFHDLVNKFCDGREKELNSELRKFNARIVPSDSNK